MTHECKHEANIAVIIDRFDSLKKDNNESKELLIKILDSIHGNGSPGLKTQVATNKNSIKLLRVIIGIVLLPIFWIVLKGA